MQLYEEPVLTLQGDSILLTKSCPLQGQKDEEAEAVKRVGGWRRRGRTHGTPPDPKMIIAAGGLKLIPLRRMTQRGENVEGVAEKPRVVSEGGRALSPLGTAPQWRCPQEVIP